MSNEKEGTLALSLWVKEKEKSVSKLNLKGKMMRKWCFDNIN
jgi:hypothetical protein